MKFLYQQSPAFPLTHLSLILPRTGVCLDPPKLRGLSRLMARLMFMGAGGMANTELNGRLERLGASMGASLSNDNFSLRLSTLTENLEAALELFLISLAQPNFDAGEFERLRAELASAWVADREESKQVRAQEVYLHEIFRGAPNGYLPDGDGEGLARCTLADVRAQFGRLREGSEPLLAVLSDLPQGEAEARIFSKIDFPTAGGQNPHPWDGFAPPPETGRRVVIVPDADTNTDELVCGAFSGPESDPDWHIQRLISFIFGGDMNSRLFRSIRGDRGLSYGASCWFESSQGRGPRDRISPFSLYTFPAAEHTAEALPLLLGLYEELVEKGVEESELQLAQQALINSYPFQRDTPQKLLGLRLGEALYGLQDQDEQTHTARLRDTTQADILRVLGEKHHPDRLVLVMLGDLERLKPLAEAIPGVERVEVRPYPATG